MELVFVGYVVAALLGLLSGCSGRLCLVRSLLLTLLALPLGVALVIPLYLATADALWTGYQESDGEVWLAHFLTLCGIGWLVTASLLHRWFQVLNLAYWAILGTGLAAALAAALLLRAVTHI